MKAQIIAKQLFWRDSGRTVTTHEAVDLLSTRLVSARCERDHAGTVLADLEASHRAAVIRGQRPDRAELLAAKAELDAADARVRALIDEIAAVRSTETSHRAQAIAAGADAMLADLAARYTPSFTVDTTHV